METGVEGSCLESWPLFVSSVWVCSWRGFLFYGLKSLDVKTVKSPLGPAWAPLYPKHCLQN